jgi:hypothetical protein
MRLVNVTISSSISKGMFCCLHMMDKILGRVEVGMLRYKLLVAKEASLKFGEMGIFIQVVD